MSEWIEPKNSLKPCPFCGGKARMLNPKRNCYRVYCRVCGVEIPWGETEEDVTKMWNLGSTAVWISAEDKLPGEDGNYLVYFSMGGMSVAHYDKVNKWTITIPAKITHWMPLPEPPAEGETEK